MPFVYIMTNRSKTFYIGTARDLRRRVWQHKNGWFKDSFTDRYKLDRLAFYEQFVSYSRAIVREKQIKGMTRLKKMALIVSMNPTWANLSEGWFERHEFEPEKKGGSQGVPSKKRRALAKKSNA